ncbi:AMP-binding enzyme family protein expressed [Citrus sinensis]|nr:AMP-binding enzyme family protein expressed [Citrus sinensis]
MSETYTVKVEEARPAADGKPSGGPVYRCIYAKDGLLESPAGLESPWQFFCDSAKRIPNNQMLGGRKVSDGKVGPYVWLTYQEVYDAAIRFGSAMRSRGVNPGDRCGIYGSNCPEWIIAMEACNSQAITYVPLYDTLGANAVEFIINHAEVSIAFVQENKIPSILSCLPRCCLYLKTIVSFANVSSSQKKEAEELGVSCFSWEEFLQLGTLDCELPLKKKTDISTIMYTSGTTGEPKGVVLTNQAVVAEVLSVDQMFVVTGKVCSEEDTYFSFLPLAHIYDQIIETHCIHKGCSIGFWRGDVRYLMEDIQELKPTMFSGVPRVYDRIYTATNSKLGNMKKGMPQNKAAPLLDSLVFSKIREAFGGRLQAMLSGAAPLPIHVEEFLRVTSGAPLTQGYVSYSMPTSDTLTMIGLTESCSGCFTSLADVFNMIGTVGVPMTTVEARLESVPEMGYDALSSVPRGEICLRGNTLFSGYYKRPDLTEEIWVYGNSFESFLVAVVVPDRKALEDWAVNHLHEAVDFKSLCENPKARKYVLDELNSTAQKHKLRGFEMLKAVHLEPTPFDIEKDLITPTFKLKRPQLLKYYKDKIDQLYSEAKGSKP